MIDKLIAYKIINSEEKAIYEYGLKCMVMLSINILTVAVIGIISGRLVPIIVLMSGFIPLRSFAGGYHLESPVLCYLVSNIILIAAVMAAANIPIFYLCLLAALSAGVILLKAPVASKNRQYDSAERSHFKKMTCKILVLEIAISVLCMALGMEEMAGYVLMAIILVGGLGIL